MNYELCGLALVTVLAAGCGGGGTSNGSVASNPTPSSVATTTAPPVTGQGNCTGKTATVASPGSSPVTPSGLIVPSGTTIQTIAAVNGARELATLPNGDLLVGTLSSTVYLVPNAENSGAAGAVKTFATMPDAEAAGVAFDRGTCSIFVGTTNGIYKIPYKDADTSAQSITKIASVRTGGDGGHSTTSVVVSNGTLYASVGSSCNACSESDPTRASIQQMHFDGSAMTARAIHIRNAIGLTVDPGTGHVWAGDAGQDDLPANHPYEFFDDVSAHGTPADYGWPSCEENHQSYGSGAACSSTVVPLVEIPAYSTIIGATFYPSSPSGNYALPSTYRGGAFLAAHGSWHTKPTGGYYAAPIVVFVPMNGDTPRMPVSWSDPTTQWKPFVNGFQQGGSTRIGRPTGLAVGSQGSLFIADDSSGRIYRVRP